jgi:hypothetical protein
MSATSCGTRSQGISVDARRLEQFGWMLFLKIMDDKDQGLEPIREGCQSMIPANLASPRSGTRHGFRLPLPATPSRNPHPKIPRDFFRKKIFGPPAFVPSTLRGWARHDH